MKHIYAQENFQMSKNGITYALRVAKICMFFLKGSGAELWQNMDSLKVLDFTT